MSYHVCGSGDIASFRVDRFGDVMADLQLKGEVLLVREVRV